METIFHKIIRKEIPASIVFEDEFVVAFKDVNPVSPIHILVVPRKTICSLASVDANDEQLLGHMVYVCSSIAKQQGLEQNGWRLVVNTGDNGGQTVKQLHMHILGGRQFMWPPG